MVSNIVPLVAVRMLTYNQEEYIAQSIESIISQKTNFRFVLIIGEDCSKDNTAFICKQYENKYPEKIQLICNPKNNIALNSLNNFNACFASGAKYIALLEGDDYWTDPYKLQKQVDFLESNPDYGLVHTGYEIIENGKIRPGSRLKKNNIPNGFVFKELICHDFFIMTATVVARRDIFIDGNNLLQAEAIKRGWKMADYPMWLEAAMKTKIAYLEDVTTCYRIVQGSLSHSKEVAAQYEFIKSNLDVKNFFIDRINVTNDIRRKIEIHHNERLLFFAFKNKNKKIAEDAYRVLKKIDTNNKKIKRKVFFLASENHFFWMLGKAYLKVRSSNFIYNIILFIKRK